MEFITDTPDNIHEMTWRQVLDYLGPSRDNVSMESKLKTLIGMYKVLGLKLDKDAAIAILDPAKHKQMIATAGAGKTTMQLSFALYMKVMQPKITGKKLYGSRILVLVYTDKNVEDIKNRHAALAYDLKRSGLDDTANIDDVVDSCTVHSFCDMWLRDYAYQCGTLNAELITERDQEELFEDCYALIGKSFPMPELNDMKVFRDTYSFMCNSMLPHDHKLVMQKYAHEGISVEAMGKMMLAYASRKKIKNVYDFMDMLTKVHELVKTNEDARRRIQKNYDVVLLDEGQDVNALMQSIISYIIGDSPFMMIADDDQTIFEFNGANIENLLGFTERYEDSKVFLMTENRRCPKNILDVGTAIITRNKKRFQKKIFSNKEGGIVELLPYTSPEGQIEALVKKLKETPANELAQTMIAYRNVSQSTYLVELLEENKIPFNLLSGTDIFGHVLYKHMFGILEMLSKPYEKSLQLNMFKVSEVNRTDMEDILKIGRRYRKKSFDFTGEYTMFYDIDYGKHMSRPKFTQALDFLSDVSKRMGSLQMKQYMGGIWHLFHKYYWDFVSEENSKKYGLEGTEELMYERVKKFFDSDLNYREFFRLYSNRVNDFRSIARTNGLNLASTSTFHKLKGLECDHMILLYMDDAIVPSMKSVSFTTDNEEDYVRHMESENRVMFVACTRARKKLTLSYNSYNPSMYIDIVKDVLEKQKNTKTLPAVDLDNPYAMPSPAIPSLQKSSSILNRF